MPGNRSFLLALSAVFILGAFLPAVVTSRASRDSDGNDSFSTADDIYFSEFKEGTLTSADQMDVYRVVDLLGDDEYHTQKLLISVTRLSGADVKGVLYEPTGAKIAELQSSGERSEVGFIVPYDTSLFLTVRTDPSGQDSSYRVETGGEIDFDNHEKDDGNNRPQVVGFSESADVTDTLNPIRDIVDHRHVDIPPGRSLEVSFDTEGPLRMDIFNETYFKFTEEGPLSNYSIKNDGSAPLRAVIRMYYPLAGEALYPDFDLAYILRMVLWSHTTTPVLNASDPWGAGTLLFEDQSNIAPLNLTRHFLEAKGDPLSFEIISSPPEIGAGVFRVRSSYNPNVVLYEEVRFSLRRNWYGSGALSVRAFDRDGEVSDTISVTVQSVNDVPFITKIGGADYKGGVFNLFAYEDVHKSYNVSYGDEDDPVSSLYFTTNETLPFVTVRPTNGTMDIGALQENVGKHAFNISIFDTNGGSRVVDMRLSIEPVNDPPSIPVINLTSHPKTVIPPGEEIVLWANGVVDPDSTTIMYTWDWGDGAVTTGNPGRHTFSNTIDGNRTITVRASDGQLSSSANITLFVQSPEDIATGDMGISIEDVAGDVVSVEERWNKDDPEETEISVNTLSEAGIDILGIHAQRRENNLEVTLEISSSIEITGAFKYHIFVVSPTFVEPYTDFRNMSDYLSMPDRYPPDSVVYAHRAYLGDPSLFNESQGNIVNKNLLVFLIHFSELIGNGLPAPVRRTDFELYAVVEHEVPYIESKGQVSRIRMSDTAGTPSLKVGNISTQDTASGTSSDPFGDFARPTAILVVVTLVVVVLVLGTISFFLVRRERRKRKEEERQFIEKVEKMRSEGKDLFGKEKAEQGSKTVSYEDLYGTPVPKGFESVPGTAPAPTLPGPGLGSIPQVQSNIMELKVETPSGGPADTSEPPKKP